MRLVNPDRKKSMKMTAAHPLLALRDSAIGSSAILLRAIALLV
jgi:hypothetical protein